jgi:carbamoyl-phosphate synthase large subunit
MEAKVREHGLPKDAAQNMRKLKAMGFSDARLARLPASAPKPTSPSCRAGVHPVYKRIDTCAAEFASPDRLHVFDLREAPSWAARLRGRAVDRKKVVILGGGPNRIGQGIEFDYCCCHAAFALPTRL